MKEVPLSLQRPTIWHVLWIPCQVLPQHLTSLVIISFFWTILNTLQTCLPGSHITVVPSDPSCPSSSHLFSRVSYNCTTSQKSYLHSHQHISYLKVLHYCLLLSQFTLAAIHTSAPTSSRFPVTYTVESNGNFLRCPHLILLDEANPFLLKICLLLLLLHSPPWTFWFNMPHRHFRPNIWKLITPNFFIKTYFSVFPDFVNAIFPLPLV